ncbi:MAG: iron donor protein CyaY [Burkholderiales bacterium]|jgi:CyaY protein|nr:iron donor protein CyaY [Burkholderiales bacterium]MCA3215340.1 iron donor protein CyaY [Burkholderiales bacterium]MCA3224538.1 iron donor protein CyaY [Burkholderiales bacterium]MCE2644628.1 iron donor protein CyaY [Burkholderiaceae bacterium]
MTDSEFDARATATLDLIEAAVATVSDSGAVDIEIERSANVLTLELADGSKVVINSQAPMRQIWVAARSGGFHFAERAGQWRDTRDDGELLTTLSRILSQQGGQPVLLG